MKEKLIKIVYVIPSLIKSGPVNVLYNIVKNLDRKRFEPIVVELREYPQHNRHNHAWFEKLGVRIDRHNYSLWYTEFCIKKIARELSEKYNEQDTVFHAHGYYPTLILAAMNGRLTMNTIHNRCDEDFSFKHNWLMASYMSNNFRKALRRLSLCVVISENMLDYYAKKGVSLIKVCNGVDAYDRKTNDERAILRNSLNIPLNVFVLLYPAGFSIRKNQVCIIEAVKKSKRQDILILFAGRGETEVKCKSLVGNDKRFRFLGFQLNMEQWWNVTDYMISSSLTEGMPMAVLEAVNQGIPCILSSIPSHNEISNNVFGDNALLFDPFNPENLVYILDNNIGNIAMSSEEIANRARAIYTSEVMAHNYENCYNNLILTIK